MLWFISNIELFNLKKVLIRIKIEKLKEDVNEKKLLEMNWNLNSSKTSRIKEFYIKNNLEIDDLLKTAINLKESYING